MKKALPILWILIGLVAGLAIMLFIRPRLEAHHLGVVPRSELEAANQQLHSLSNEQKNLFIKLESSQVKHMQALNDLQQYERKQRQWLESHKSELVSFLTESLGQPDAPVRRWAAESLGSRG